MCFPCVVYNLVATEKNMRSNAIYALYVHKHMKLKSISFDVQKRKKTFHDFTNQGHRTSCVLGGEDPPIHQISFDTFEKWCCGSVHSHKKVCKCFPTQNKNSWNSYNVCFSILSAWESVLKGLDSFGHHRGNFCNWKTTIDHMWTFC